MNHGVPPKRVDVYVKDLRTADAPIRPIIHGLDYRFVPANYGDDLYVLTDYQAENYRIVRFKLNDPAPEHWQTIVPEGKDPISEFSIVGGKLFATGLHDVVTETRIFDLDGKQIGHITYPTLGAASARVLDARSRRTASTTSSRSTFRRRSITTTLSPARRKFSPAQGAVQLRRL